jgi:hypothetical protein
MGKPDARIDKNQGFQDCSNEELNLIELDYIYEKTGWGPIFTNELIKELALQFKEAKKRGCGVATLTDIDGKKVNVDIPLLNAQLNSGSSARLGIYWHSHHFLACEDPRNLPRTLDSQVRDETMKFVAKF